MYDLKGEDMWLDRRNSFLHISLEELQDRQYDTKKLLNPETIEMIARQVTSQYCVENNKHIEFEKVYGLLNNELIICILLDSQV